MTPGVSWAVGAAESAIPDVWTFTPVAASYTALGRAVTLVA